MKLILVALLLFMLNCSYAQLNSFLEIGFNKNHIGNNIFTGLSVRKKNTEINFALKANLNRKEPNTKYFFSDNGYSYKALEAIGLKIKLRQYLIFKKRVGLFLNTDFSNLYIRGKFQAIDSNNNSIFEYAYVPKRIITETSMGICGQLKINKSFSIMFESGVGILRTKQMYYAISEKDKGDIIEILPLDGFGKKYALDVYGLDSYPYMLVSIAYKLKKAK